ncbi:ribonuclease HIII [Bacillus marinisedimentorum]|uniref:ribonuclease HIII n=1 Tax=Bacillus marinisedimentorum TaxID=1821260 RepID=UPI000872EA26|nr:ribonuclease HIII [Bacillus marinisedimentorum]
MSNGVLKISDAVLKEMKNHYKEYLQEKVPQGGVFTAKLPGCTITAYKSGKVLFQGKESGVEIAAWEAKGTTGTSKRPSAPKSEALYRPPENIESLSIIGSDEVGTGDYFGPMTVVAAYVPADMTGKLKSLGVKDSKNLNDTQITDIAKAIKSIVPHSLLILRNEKYNELQENGMTQGKMKALLHNQAINHLVKKIKPEKPDGVLIDQFAQPAVYFKHIRGKEQKIKKNVYFSTKAEGVHLSVAAASIIARYAFIKEFEKLSEAAGMVLPKGAGARVDEAAAVLMRKHGAEAMRKFAKVHFANTEKALNLMKR